LGHLKGRDRQTVCLLAVNDSTKAGVTDIVVQGSAGILRVEVEVGKNSTCYELEVSDWTIFQSAWLNAGGRRCSGKVGARDCVTRTPPRVGLRIL
jgi:hypothetical protein